MSFTKLILNLSKFKLQSVLSLFSSKWIAYICNKLFRYKVNVNLYVQIYF